MVIGVALGGCSQKQTCVDFKQTNIPNCLMKVATKKLHYKIVVSFCLESYTAWCRSNSWSEQEREVVDSCCHYNHSPIPGS